MAHARIRSVTFKNGGATIRVIHRPERRSLAKNRACTLIDSFGDVAGMAIVAWAADGTSAGLMVVGEASPIPSILVPDFVRNRLLAERIESWTLDSVFGDKK